MKKIILLFTILFIVTCEKEDGDSYSKDLIGNWEGVMRNYSYHIISTVSQTVNNPYKSGTGSIVLQGAEEAILQYMYLYSVNGVLQISIAQFPFGLTVEETHYVLYIYDYGDFGTPSQLTKYYSDVGELYEGELDFTINGYEITVTSGALYHTFLNDSVSITGTLAPAQSNVTAGTDVELGSLDWTFDTYEVNFNIKDDNSFDQTIVTIDTETLERSGTWEATSDEITFHYPTSSDKYSYNISGSNLELTQNKDLCISNPDECLPQYELMYGMEGGSLENVVMKETTFFNK
ncbi:MAG: hypothetical protein IIB95_09710 [Candidatus Marinimicrobia bacterium]|nr:hypothetical protein [Candidatus Neomarinimicrobiota bacterium]MCH7764000.1 hypothetical protein [Candidatus Neomarinimicrobiota bacterium]